jgi:dephospho-CoA kinase
MFIIGVTGGIGCGKSLVASMFAELGVPIIDVDQVNKEISLAGQPCFNAIVSQFGAQVVGQDGELDRMRLRSIIFEDAEQRKALEAILHPAIYNACLQKLSALKQDTHQQYAYALLLVPLLFEHKNFVSLVQRSLVIDCPQALQIERVMQRDHINQTQALAIIDAQMPRQQRLAMADDIIVNDQDLSALKQQVLHLHQFYNDLAAA